MKKPTLEEIAIYLPYGLEIEIHNYKSDYVGIKRAKVNGHYFIGSNLYLKYEGGSTGKSYPESSIILRPMSDIDKEIEVDGEKFVPFEILNLEHTFFLSEDCKKFGDGTVEEWCLDELDEEFSYWKLEWLPHRIIQKLASWFFDINNLIEQGKAIDINTIK